MRKIPSLLLLLVLLACAPVLQGVGQDTTAPSLTEQFLVTSDDRNLPVREWLLEENSKGIVIGVHGFNDYGNFLNPYFPEMLNKSGYELITYDQRGFGENPDRGRFSTEDALTSDLFTMVTEVRKTHQPDKIFLLGESMGGAIVIATLARYPDLKIDGVVLSAPAVWGHSTWPWYQRWSLNIMSHIAPGMSLSGGGIVQPTDNMDVWRDWSRDPLVVRGTRIEALWGVSQIMETALKSADKLKRPMFILYGANDEIIPKEPMVQFMDDLTNPYRFAYYPDGWHMLPRDLQYETVIKDIVSYLNDPMGAFPSGFEENALKNLKNDL